ncbi:MAG: hypothetical protein VX475_01200 [Myxococcota bacterium]|nr:hypothetical protein [Myxococcota bacterium]
MINEIVFQGIFGCTSPVKLGSKETYVDFDIPPSMTATDIQAVVMALFFPSRLDTAAPRGVEFGQDVKIAVTFEAVDRSWRILRRDSDDSLRLQMREANGFKDIARGGNVEAVLHEKLRVAPWPIFSLLSFWRWDEAIPRDEVAFDIDALPATTRDIIFRYKVARELEVIEDRISQLGQRAEMAKERLGEGFKLEDKLEKAQAKYKEIAIAELSEEDLKLLGERDERLAEFEHQLRRLEAEEEDAREEVHVSLPDKPWRNQLFWIGLAIAATAIATSIAMRETLRPIAAANVLGLGLTAWALLLYFTDMERAGVHVVRLDSIKRRLNQVREKQVAFKEKINHLLIHAGVENEAELAERFEKSTRLKEIIDKMEAQLDKVRQRPVYQTARRELDEIQRELVEARSAKEDAGQSMMSAYQLENDLKNLGFDPATILEELENQGTRQEAQPEYERDEFSRLAEIAARCGLMGSSGLDERVVKMWAKICAHVLGSRFKDLALSPSGELRVSTLTAEQLERWGETRPREKRMLAIGLSTAISVNIPSKYGSLNALIVPDPGNELSSEHATKFYEVMQSASQKAQVILLG